MRESALEARIHRIIEPAIEGMGYALVRVKLYSDQSGQALQIMAENPETGRISLDECTLISRNISPLLDVEDPLASAYRLEVSSPGIDRPLTRATDFMRFTGFEAKVELDVPAASGQKRFQGIIKNANENNIVLANPDGNCIEMPIENIANAKLVMSDALLAATKEKLPVIELTEGAM
ncbi:MAG: ribosome maturation factor RimP [Alphaproteobacteria bacterium]|nr:ribosome maturation factor RimP [Alphaproteobacteria bacterium]